jgi:hypothetical protein
MADGSDQKGRVHRTLGVVAEKNACLEREGVQDQGAGDDRTQDQSE